MDVIQFFGCLGGIVYLVCFIIKLTQAVIKVMRDYEKYKFAYEANKEDDNVKTIGFKTEKEKAEIEARLRK